MTVYLSDKSLTNGNACGLKCGVETRKAFIDPAV